MTTPVLIAEILSASTEIRDRLKKRLSYQSLNSLQEYVLISQDKAQIEIYRQTRAGWELESCGIGDVIQLHSVNFKAPIESLYSDVLTYLGQ